MRKLIPLLLITWALGAVGWALLQDDEDQAPNSVEKPDEAPAPAPGPPPIEAPRPAPAPRGIPWDVLSGARQNASKQAQAEVWRWIDAEPGRLTKLLFATADSAGTAVRTYQRTQRWLVAWRAAVARHETELRDALAALGDALAKPKDARAVARTAAVLAALAVLGEGARAHLPALAELGGDEKKPRAIRAVAAGVLLEIDDQDLRTQDTIAGLLRSAGGGDAATSWLLDRVRERGERMRNLLPALLEAHTSMRPRFRHRATALRALAAADPTNPVVRERLAGELHPEDKWIAKVARETLFAGSVEDVLAIVRQLKGIARVIGIEILLGRKVERSVLSPLLVPVLLDESMVARTRAVTAMARVGTDTGPYMAAIERLLGHEDDVAQWVTGARALGALASVPGDKTVAIQRLMGLTRSPNVQVRITAVQSVLMHRTRVDAKLEMLAELLKDSDRKVRAEAVDGLGELVSEDKRAAEHLKLALSDSDEEIRALAKYWLDADDDADDADDR